MAMSRNARRLASRKREGYRATDKLNSQAVLARQAIVKDNLSRSPKRNSSVGLVSTIYLANMNPVSKGRSKKFSSGPAN